MLIEIFSGKYENSFKDISTSLSLVEFGLITAKIFNIKEIQIKCEKLGYIDCDGYEIPLISQNTSKWIKKLILTKDNEIYNLDKWCKLSKNLFFL